MDPFELPLKRIVLKCSDKDNKFPIEILNQWDITHLEIIGGSFTYFPEDISVLKNLKSFSLISSQVKSLPPELFLLPELDSLNLKNNKISALPKLLQQSSIKHLNLGRNHLTSTALKNAFNNFPHLVTLDLGHNRLRSVPVGLKFLRELKRLNLEGNKIKDFPLELEELKRLGGLTHLSLENNLFTNQERVRIQKEYKFDI